MDDGNDAVVLLGVDFQKVFNRMEFAVCIEQLEMLGASQGSLSMVKSFLTNRTMRMKLGNATSKEVEILRGSPQGSVLGGALYCATTQSLQEARRTSRHPPGSMGVPPINVLNNDFDVPTVLPAMTLPVRFFPNDSQDSGKVPRAVSGSWGALSHQYPTVLLP